MPALWTCPNCDRVFRQKNQVHSCGKGSRRELLAGKPAILVKLYADLEKQLKSFSSKHSARDRIEMVAKGRYVLLRTTRIFADVVFMRDALRVAILLDRTVKNPMFFKTLHMSANRVAHVAKIHDSAELRAVMPYVRQAYRHALNDASCE